MIKTRIVVRLHPDNNKTKVYYVEEQVRTSFWKFWERIWIVRGMFTSYKEAYELNKELDAYE